MDQDPEKIGWLVGALLAGSASVAAVVKTTKSRLFTGTKVDDLSKQVDGRFSEVCKRLDKLDGKYEDTHVMLREYLREHGERLVKVETRVETMAHDHGRRLDNLERR